jgi:hypothetical protein
MFFFIELRTSTCHMHKWDAREDIKECKKKSWPLSPPHIVNIIWLDYISTTFNHIKFVSGLINILIIHSCYIHYVVHLWI